MVQKKKRTGSGKLNPLEIIIIVLSVLLLLGVSYQIWFSFLQFSSSDFWVIVSVLFVGGGVLLAVPHLDFLAPGYALARKFASLGTLSGRTKQEIIDVVGFPTSISAMPDNKALLQWMSMGAFNAYHIALIFDGEICEGVSHEFLHQG